MLTLKSSGDMIKMDQDQPKRKPLNLEARLEVLKRAGFGEEFIKEIEESDRAMEEIPNLSELNRKVVDKIYQLREEARLAQNNNERKGGSSVSNWYDRVVQYIRNYF